jgi:GT2 family glycosyltransferase
MHTPEPTPRISIVVPTRNRHSAIRDCVNACLRSEYRHHLFEVVVIDDGSKPPIADFGVANVRVIRQQPAGPAAARNSGIRAAAGQWIAFTDDDCRPRADWLSELEKACSRYPDALIGGSTVNALTANPYSTTSQFLVSYLYYYFEKFPKQRFFTSSNMAASREQLLNIGGFDESFPLPAAEDRDLCDRWVENGGTLHYLPLAVADHMHEMGFAGFLRQQFRYGRGAKILSRRRAARGRTFRMEPTLFYAGLFAEPFRSTSIDRALQIFALLLVSQVTNVAGYAAEAARRNRK